jgi:hypothetical protein
MGGTFKKTVVKDRALFGTTEKGELKLVEKWSAKASTIHWGSVITFGQFWVG